MHNQQNINSREMRTIYKEKASGLSYYPVDLSSFLTISKEMIALITVPYHGNVNIYHPITIVHQALANWNQYLSTNENHHLNVFLTQARWLVEHEVHIGSDASGWPISLPHPDVHSNSSWLSATMQGCALSVLLRAYQLTGEDGFLLVAQRVVCTFGRDILDGGITTSVGEDGIFFEEVAVYPAAHAFNGLIFAVLGLYDYMVITGDVQIKELIQRSLSTMPVLLSEFDVGFWTRIDLLHKDLASPANLALQINLLEALATYPGCEHCLEWAIRWKSYQHQLGSRLRYKVVNRIALCNRILWSRIRSLLFHKIKVSHPLRVCVPIYAFPITGGTRAVLASVAQVMEDSWDMEYLTQDIGPNREDFTIHKFGIARAGPWQFPMVWLYFLAGLRKLISLMRHGSFYHIVLPQDGVFTSAFAAIAAKLVGVRVVCIDHGNLTLLKSSSYRAERLAYLGKLNRSWTSRCLSRRLYTLYWPSLWLLARISARLVDHFLIPGVVGDGTEEVCRSLSIPTSRMTRFGSMIDTNRYIPLAVTTRARIREEHGIPANSIVITIACRLAPEKGIDIALEALNRILSEISTEVRTHVRIVIAGDGPLRVQIEDTIRSHDWGQICLLLGEISADDIIQLLGMSDIFLYTSIRGACISMAVLEAMASGCAVVASTRPMSNAQLLAEERGIAVPAEDAEQTSKALLRLVNDVELRSRMGHAARSYVETHHSPVMFKRTLMRASYWSELGEILNN